MKLYTHIEKTKINVSSNGKNVKIYVCGPTVYNHVHIGNLRPVITFDVLNRLLLELDYQVDFIHNITDIDDKIIDRAKKEGKSESAISSYYEKQYFLILDQLNIYKKNLKFPKVSEHIDDIINYIQEIINHNFAYFKDGDVYFDTLKSNQYGSISNKNIEELIVGEKSESNTKKTNNQDFVLWKKTDQGLNWDASFSRGRPGWHTECSCLINKYLGKQIDIHGGGVDLKFPHHENENIQNIAVNNLPLARIWMHVGHLNINNEKMSKSLNNFVLAKDILAKEKINTIRWFFYQTNYSNPLNFSDENLDYAKKEIDSIINNLNIFKSHLIIANKLNLSLKFDQNYLNELINDFNFPNTITFINEKIKEGHQFLKENDLVKLNFLFFNVAYLLTNILGLVYQNIHTQETIKLLQKWDTFKKAKNFEESDKIRKILMERKLI